jgi:hypothetical protein
VSRRRYAHAAVRIVAAGVLALAAAVFAFLYEYAISISAGLCGSHARWWLDVVAVAVPLLVVGSWGLLHGWWILAAWPAAVLAAAACLSLVSYLQPDAHGHCETMTPYERNVFSPGTAYSTKSRSIASPPRLKITPSGPRSSKRQPGSWRL